MKEFGFKDILHKVTVRVKFSRMNSRSESRITFIYIRESVFKTRKYRWKFEHEYQTKGVSAPFKAFWIVRNKVCLDTNKNKVNLKFSVSNAILSINTKLKFCDLGLGAR